MDMKLADGPSKKINYSILKIFMITSWISFKFRTKNLVGGYANLYLISIWLILFISGPTRLNFASTSLYPTYIQCTTIVGSEKDSSDEPSVLIKAELKEKLLDIQSK